MKTKKAENSFVLDSFAVITYLKEEPGWEQVRNFLWEAYRRKKLLFLNYVNLGEVYYITYREKGPVFSDRAIALMKQWPLAFVGVEEEIALIAGRIKAENKLSYADAYAVATALSEKATVVTGDKEFKSVEDIVPIHWLPPNR